MYQRTHHAFGAWALALLALAPGGPALAAEGADAEALAKKLSNPVADLISVPFQFNADTDIGPLEKGDKAFINVQPVIPVSIGEDWNLISRTILPLVHQDDIFPGAGSQTGLGDVVQSLFFSPKAPTAGGLIWGVGPVFLLPTATDKLLGADQWGLGPTAVVLRQQGPWTYGGLANHIWGVAGSSRLEDIDATFLQPFLSYTTPTAWTYSINSESTYDWAAEEWSVPVNISVNRIIRIGGQLFSIGGGPRWWVDSAPNGPEGLGLRLQVTLLLPKKN